MVGYFVGANAKPAVVLLQLVFPTARRTDWRFSFLLADIRAAVKTTCDEEKHKMHGFDSIQIPDQREVLIAFSDLKDFTPFVRDLDEAQLFAVLSDYYELIGDIVAAGGGKVVKFIGDAALLAFPAEGVDAGVLALRELRQRGDRFFADGDRPCRHVVKAHCGPVCCGQIGTRDDKRFDLFGQTGNTAALLPSNGMVLTPQV